MTQLQVNAKAQAAKKKTQHNAIMASARAEVLAYHMDKALVALTQQRDEVRAAQELKAARLYVQEKYIEYMKYCLDNRLTVAHAAQQAWLQTGAELTRLHAA